MADERTLRGRQLQDLEIAMKALGLAEENVETDVQALIRHRDLSAQLTEIRLRIQTLESAAEETAKEVRHYAAKLEAARSRYSGAHTKVTVARREIAELDSLERDNPRLFAGP